MLNPNYLDDMREIDAAIAALPSCVDNGYRWLACDHQVMLKMIRRIVRAHVRSVVPVPFLPTGVRRAVIALGSTRLLPRDLLREVHRFLGGGVDQLDALFSKYVKLTDIRGLHFRATNGGVRGPRVDVRSMERSVDGYMINGARFFCRWGHQRGDEYYRMSLAGVDFDVVGWQIKDQMVLKTFIIEFDSDFAAIAFTHKSLHKWLGSA